MKKLGLIVNPIAGMGGRAGLKGTDGKEILEQARELGVKPEAPAKAVKALEKLEKIKDRVTIYTAAGDMGENEAKEAGLTNVEVVYTPGEGDTSVSDTNETAKKILEADVDLILFVGGDGTARDIHDAVGQNVPVLGVPGGVKIYSAVHANSPESAGRVTADFLRDKGIGTKEAEVIDLDEEGFRNDEVDIQVFGYMNVPHDDTHLQNLKSPSPQSDGEAQQSAALHVIDTLEDDVYYIIGSGSTPSQILKELDQPVTILGVDIMRNKETIAKDVNENEILEVIGDEKAKLIVTPMGGQGYILGRGNQQLSARVLDHVDKADLTVVATPGKLKTLGTRDMLIYTMNDETDNRLSGYYKVVVGYGREMMKKASSQND